MFEEEQVLMPLSRRQALKGLGCLPLLSGASFVAAEQGSTRARSAHMLVFPRPASDWLEALPVGNGQIGAMVYGGIAQERIQLNHVELWSGHSLDTNRDAARLALPTVRQLLFEGRYEEANALAQREMMVPMDAQSYGSYQMLGDLRLTFFHPELTPRVGTYQRRLDLMQGLVSVEYTADGHVFRRKVISSYPDRALRILLETDHPQGLDFALVLARAKDAVIARDRDHILLSGQPAGGGVRFAARLACDTDSGEVRREPDGYRVKGCQRALVTLTAATDLLAPDPEGETLTRLSACRSKPWELFEADHVADHRRHYDAVAVELGEDEPLQAAEVRLDNARKGLRSDLMAEAYFNLSRYLFIASSRPGSLPPNLQGLWADGFNPPWSADYHININLQMNYWPAEVCGLGALTVPLFDFAERLLPYARRTAKIAYGCRGAVAHYTSNPWGHVALDGQTQWGLWPDGLAWLSLHFWERWLYSGDRTFLETRAYPLLKACAEFTLDYLVEHPETGKLVAGPATSPENGYRMDNGEPGYVTMGPAMSQSIAYATLTHTAEAARLLGKDAGFVQQLEGALEKLQRLRIGADGRIMEWPEPFDEVEPGHRHISHLFGLFPGSEIDRHLTPELAQAAIKTLDERLSHGGGHTGWSAAWLVMFRARLGQGEATEAMLRKLFTEATAPNFFDTHPGSDGPIFQIDGNLGAAAAIAELLMQSHGGRIELLPALPSAWGSGRARGLLARGGIAVDLAWRDGRLLLASLTAERDTTCTLVAPAGAPFRAFGERHLGSALLRLPGGEPVTIEFAGVE